MVGCTSSGENRPKTPGVDEVINFGKSHYQVDAIATVPSRTVLSDSITKLFVFITPLTEETKNERT